MEPIPPMLEPYPVGLENFVLPKEVQREFVRGIMEGFMSEMEMMSEFSDNIKDDWQAIRAANRDVLRETREVVEQQQAQGPSRDEILGGAEDQLRRMGLAPEVVAAAMTYLSNQVDDQAQVITNDTVEAPEPAGPPEARKIKRSGEDEERELHQRDRQRRRPRGDSPQQAPSPYQDVVDADALPDALPDVEGLPQPRQDRPAGPPRPMTLAQGIALGSNFGQLRQAASDRINQWGSEWAANIPRPPMEDGFWVDEAGNATRAAHQAGEAYERRLGNIGRAQGIIQSVGQGGGLSGAMGAIGGGIARAAAPIGIAYGAVNLIDNTMTDQRAAARPYQQTFGGGVLDQTGHRIEEQLFSRFGTFGLMGNDEASRLFRDVSSLGLQGDERRSALGFATDNYREFGTDVSTSMRLIRIATQDGTEVLDEFQKSMKALAEVAEESGVSVQRAHEHYVTALEGARRITTGEAASDMARMTSAIATSFDDTPLDGVDLAPLLSNNVAQYRAMAALGIDDAEFQAGLISGDRDIGMAVIETSVDQLIQHGVNVEAIPADVQQQINSIMSAAGGNPSADDLTDISALLIRSGVINPRALQVMAGNFGLGSLTQAQLMSLVTDRVVGGQMTQFGEAVQETEDAYLEQSRPQYPMVSSRPGVGMISRGDNRMHELGLIEEPRPMKTNVMAEGVNVEVYDFAREYFGQAALRGGEGSWAIESILENDPAQWVGQEFTVRDARGRERVVSFSDLLSEMDALEAGQIYTADGEALHERLGYDVMSEQSTRGPRTSRGGTFDTSVEPSASQDQQQEQKIVVEAIGPLQEMLAFYVDGGSDGAYARRHGLPMPAQNESGGP